MNEIDTIHEAIKQLKEVKAMVEIERENSYERLYKMERRLELSVRAWESLVVKMETERDVAADRMEFEGKHREGYAEIKEAI